MLHTILFCVMLALCMVIHELGHAVAMRECGVKIKRISLLGIPGLGEITLPFRIKYFPEAKVVVHPLLIGAYVEPENGDSLKLLSVKDQLYIYCAGALANIILGSSLFILSIALTVYGDERNIEIISQIILFCIAVSLSVIMSILLVKFRRTVCIYLLPIIGIFVTFIFLKSMLSIGSFLKPVGMSDVISSANQSGPITSKYIKNEYLSILTSALFHGAVLNILIGLFNLIFFFPLDGGRVLGTILPVKLAKYHAYSTAPIILLLIVLSLGKDAYNLVVWLLSLVL